MHRHALPPGFVLQSQKKKAAEDEAAREISLDEFLEVEVRRTAHCVPPVLALSCAGGC